MLEYFVQRYYYIKIDSNKNVKIYRNKQLILNKKTNINLQLSSSTLYDRVSVHVLHISSKLWSKRDYRLEIFQSELQSTVNAEQLSWTLYALASANLCATPG